MKRLALSLATIACLLVASVPFPVFADPALAAPGAMGVGGPADEGTEQTFMLEGVLVSKSPEELVMKDGDGNAHHFKLTEQTRYVWGERASPSDFKPGASIRTVYFTAAQKPVASSVWVLGARREG